MDDELDIQPWPVIELLGRASALAAVAQRGFLEEAEDLDVFTRETDRFELSSWVRAELANWITQTELAIIRTPAGDLNEEALELTIESLYAAGAIAWALRAVNVDHLPVPDTDAYTLSVLKWAPEPWDNVRRRQKLVRLRSVDDLASERERMELWYWRGTDDVSEEYLSEVVSEVVQAGLIPIVDGDFATDDGIPFSRLTEDEQGELTWIAGLRLHALNWVCGFGETWDEVPMII